ncbi:MAG: histidinol-phosphatase [Kiritimatiellaeota bacterium]|nr:histidinol-phosphatase [Kiritimatiellota bacterium]
MSIPTANWHTHTNLCKHATGSVDDYCRAAVRAGLHILGFSDHAPLPDGRWNSVRMEWAELGGYCRALERARQTFPGLEIRKGLECEFVPEFREAYTDVFLGEFELEYLVGGAHWYPWRGEWVGLYGNPMDGAMLHAYADYLIASIRSGLFAFIAHPDLFGNAYPTWDADCRACSQAIIEASLEMDLPLEINAYGLRKPYVDTPAGRRPKYPWRPFWELAGELGAPAIVSSDAHRPEDIAAEMDACFELARQCGLQPLADPSFPRLETQRTFLNGRGPCT